jgi:hypothetical protein
MMSPPQAAGHLGRLAVITDVMQLIALMNLRIYSIRASIVEISFEFFKLNLLGRIAVEAVHFP